MKGSPARSIDHNNAILYPVTPETDLVDLLRIVTTLVTRFGSDHVLREGVASLIEGSYALCNGQWGRRLDMDQCRQVLRVQAHRLGYDIDSEQFTNAAVTDADFVR